MLQKKTTDGFIYEHVAGETDAKGKPKFMQVDYTALLDKMRVKITDMHIKAIGYGDTASKSTLTLLNVSETCQKIRC